MNSTRLLSDELSFKIKTHLRSSIRKCDARGLLKSSYWALEQIIGMKHSLDDTVTGSHVRSTSDKDHGINDDDIYHDIASNEVDQLMFAKSLIVSRDYQRCVHVLTTSSTQQQSSLRMFLLAYAQYMAGEKVRDQKMSEVGTYNASKSNSSTNPEKAKDGVTVPPAEIPKKIDPNIDAETSHAMKNQSLQIIFNDLYPVYSTGRMRSDGFLLYIFAVVVRDLHKQHGKPLEMVMAEMKQSCGGRDRVDGLTARALFMESICAYPWNWSCWLELAALCISDNQSIPQWEELSAVAGRSDDNGCQRDWDCAKVMYACFLIHVFIEKHNGEMAMQIIQTTLPVMPQSISLLTQVGLAYYSMRQYDEAEASFAAVRGLDPFRLSSMDTYSNILYVKEKQAELSFLAHSVVEVDKFCPETCCVVGNYYSLKGQHERAVQYFQRALRLNNQYLSAWTLMGHEYMELRNTAAAIQCYRNAVQISEIDYRAWYGLGQTYEMLHLYQYANYYYRKAAYLRPDDARMWSAVGNCLLKLSPSNRSHKGSRLRAEAIRSFERAVGCGDKEGIATRDLARLCRDEGDVLKAAEHFFSFVHLRNTFHCNAAEEGSFLSPNISAYSVDSGAVDADQAEAVLFMIHFYKGRGLLQPMEAFCNRLLGFVGTEGEEARAILREIRSLSTSHQQGRPPDGHLPRNRVANHATALRSPAVQRGNIIYSQELNETLSPAPMSVDPADGLTPSQSLQRDYTSLSLRDADDDRSSASHSILAPTSNAATPRYNTRSNSSSSYTLT